MRVQEVVMCLRVLVVVGDDVQDLVVVLPLVVVEEADKEEEEEEVEVEVEEADVVEEVESLDSTLNWADWARIPVFLSSLDMKLTWKPELLHISVTMNLAKALNVRKSTYPLSTPARSFKV